MGTMMVTPLSLHLICCGSCFFLSYHLLIFFFIYTRLLNGDDEQLRLRLSSLSILLLLQLWFLSIGLNLRSRVPLAMSRRSASVGKSHDCQRHVSTLNNRQQRGVCQQSPDSSRMKLLQYGKRVPPLWRLLYHLPFDSDYRGD